MFINKAFCSSALASAELVRRVAFLIEIIMRVPQKQKYRRRIELADAARRRHGARGHFNEPGTQQHQQQPYSFNYSAFSLLL
jgi:hypothetical protein